MKEWDLPLRGEDVRKKNERLILKAIQTSDGISQSEVVQLTGLKAPTVLRIFSMLESQGLIAVASDIVEKENDKKGRKPVYYRVAPDAHYVIGTEFWSQTAHALIVDFRKKPVYFDEIKLKEKSNADEVVEQLSALVEKSIETAGIDRSKILGIGVGAPGRIQVDKGEIINYSRIEGFINYPLGKKLWEQFHLPIAVANNAGVIAMNAYRRGVAQNEEALFTYFIRHGVGGAFITGGTLFSILGTTAFEVGHTIAQIGGKPCYCGADGCLEAYISEAAILEKAQEHGYHFSSIEEVEQALQQKDQTVKDLIVSSSGYLGVSARNMLRLLSPSGFLVISRFPALSALFAEVVRQAIDGDSYNAHNAVSVYSNAYSAMDAGQGACDLIFDRYFTSGVENPLR